MEKILFLRIRFGREREGGVWFKEKGAFKECGTWESLTEFTNKIYRGIKCFWFMGFWALKKQNLVGNEDRVINDYKNVAAWGRRERLRLLMAMSMWIVGLFTLLGRWDGSWLNGFLSWMVGKERNAVKILESIRQWCLLLQTSSFLF